MNRKLVLSVMMALLPLTITAANVHQLQDEEPTVAKHAAPRAAKEKLNKDDLLIVPVDLDLAASQYDVVLPQEPVKMTADSIYARNTDGYIQGRGNVDLYQGTDEIHAHYVEGNTQTQMFYVPGDAVLVQGTNAMTGSGVIYNGKTRSGTWDKMAGYMSPTTYIRGTGGEMYDNVGYLKSGLVTTPHAVAETPDYYLTGDDIRIYPGVKFTSENTKLWFKHACILTYGHYEGRLDNNSRKNYLFSLLPRPDYSKDNGFGVYGDADFPVSQDGSLFFRVGYRIYTEIGFKPTAELIKDSKYGRFSFGYSTEESSSNDNHIWATKFPEFNYRAPRLYFGKTGIYVDNKLSWGRWREDYTGTGAHKGYRTEVSHTPIPLWRGAGLRFFAGYQRDTYALKNAERRDPFNGVVLSQSINPRLGTTFWYYKNNLSGYTPYRFDNIDDPRQKGFAVSYVLTPRDTIIFSMDQNLDTKDIADRNFIWVRDLHSFMATIIYKQVDKSWEFHVKAKDF